MAEQRDLFQRGPSRASVAARRSVPVRPMVVEAFSFDGSDPRLVPRPGVVIPDELRLPTDDSEWQPERG